MNQVGPHTGSVRDPSGLPDFLQLNWRMSNRSSRSGRTKFLLVGDSDGGKGEILASLQDGAGESPHGYSTSE